MDDAESLDGQNVNYCSEIHPDYPIQLIQIEQLRSAYSMLGGFYTLHIFQYNS